MAPSQALYLPDGQTFTVKSVFAGWMFSSPEMNTHHNAFPIGWTVVLNTEDESVDGENSDRRLSEASTVDDESSTSVNHNAPKRRIRPFTKPTLRNDNLFISSISLPSSSEFKPASSPTRQIAMMLWITLYWYFHQEAPSLYTISEASQATPEAGRPKGEWKINIRRDGVLRGRNLIPKLERMGLIASANTAVGTSNNDSGEEWADMFVSRRMFWQTPGRLFLFSLQPNRSLSSFPGSPVTSRPGSPISEGPQHRHAHTISEISAFNSAAKVDSDLPGGPMPTSLQSPPVFPLSPFYSSSHLPTYYPPGPLQYTFTNSVRHPLRPKPPRMGEVFYTRYVPSVGQYLSFRVASCSPKPVPYLGPCSTMPPQNRQLMMKSDSELLESWMAKPRVKEFWGDYKSDFITSGLNLKHSFPVIGLWDGIPFGYFEIYWVKEDILGRHLGGDAHDWDRGLHVLIGEEWARGKVPIWLTSLAHWAFVSEYRTMNIALEPRVDNTRFLTHLETSGFFREKQITFPHKQSWYVRLRREEWEAPAL